MKPVKLKGRVLHRAAGIFCITAMAMAVTLVSVQAGTDTSDSKAMDNKAIDNKEMATSKQSTSIWDQKELTGDWGGERTALRDQGIDFTFNDIGDFLSDVSGSQTHHATYFGRFRGNLDIDFKKLADVDGHLFVSAMYQYGRNLSGGSPYLNIFSSTSSIAGEESLRLDEAWYEQGFWDSKLKLKVGQIACVNDFGSTGFFDILMNDETGYAPNILFGPNQPFSPSGKPGAELTIMLDDITKGLYIKGGGFVANRDPYHPDGTGLNWQNDFRNGAVGAGEIGYKEQNTQYDGHYMVGVVFNELDNRYTDLATGRSLDGNYVGYFSLNKSVYHPMENGKLNTEKGLDVLFQLMGAPGDRNSRELETLLGLRYTGLIEGRDHDEFGFGAIYTDASPDLSTSPRSGEEDFELTYKIQVFPWFYVQPDVQAIFNPLGNTSQSDILVVGLRTIVNF